MSRLEYDYKLSKWLKSCPKCNKTYVGFGDTEQDAIQSLLLYFTTSNASYDGLYSYCKECIAHKTYNRIPNGLSREEMATAQKHRCGICTKAIDVNKTRNVLVDHDHKTRRIRLLLCVSCNHRMSGVDDDEWLALALNYRDRFRKQHA